MKCRPVIFAAWEVRAALRRDKTQFRRIVKPQPVGHNAAEPGDFVWFAGELNRVQESRGRNKRAMGLLNAVPVSCPFGPPGSRLWVRESLYLDSERGWRYTADVSPLQVSAEAYDEAAHWLATRPTKQGFVSASGMPRWACRLPLEVVAVDFERIQDISEDDAKAEGFQTLPIDCVPGTQYRAAAEHHWQKPDSPISWARNDLVRAVTFKVLDEDEELA